MIIHRRYEHDPEAVGRVVEILYHFLIETPDDGAKNSQTSVPEECTSTCVSGESE